MVLRGDFAQRAPVAREALDALAEARVGTDVIAVADTAPPSVAVGLRDHLETHAEAFGVGVGEAQWIPTGVRLAPDDTDHLSQPVHTLLLERAMSGPAGASPHTLVRTTT